MFSIMMHMSELGYLINPFFISYGFLIFFLFISKSFIYLVIMDLFKMDEALNFDLKFKLNILKFVSLLVLFMNYSSLVPFSWKPTTQLSFNFSLLMTFFLTSLVVNFFSLVNFLNFVVHLVQSSVPLFISIVLFPIELISILVRPITLILRLTANISSGHLISGFMGDNLLSSFPSLMFFIIMLVVFFFSCLEFLTNCIQSVIICVLVFIYLGH